MPGKFWKTILATAALGAVSVSGIAPAAADPDPYGGGEKNKRAQVTDDGNLRQVQQERTTPSGIYKYQTNQKFDYPDQSYSGSLHQRDLVKDGEYQESHVYDATDSGSGSGTQKTDMQYVKERKEPLRYSFKP